MGNCTNYRGSITGAQRPLHGQKPAEPSPSRSRCELSMYRGSAPPPRAKAHGAFPLSLTFVSSPCSLRWDVTVFYVLRPKERRDCTSHCILHPKVYRSCPLLASARGALWGAAYERTKMSYPSLIMRMETMMRKKTLTNLFPFKIARRVPTREPSILQRAMKIAAL